MNQPLNLPLRPEFELVTPYGAPQLAVQARLNVNENPYGVPAQVVSDMAAAVSEIAGELNRYPDRDAIALREDLVNYLAAESSATDLTSDHIWVGNGSNEVMLHLHQAFAGPGRSIVSFEPSYSMYPEYARNTLSELVSVPREADFSINSAAAGAAIFKHAPTLVLIASPNNPTGTAVPLAQIDEICEAAAQVPGGCLVVVDEAYGEFRRPGVPSAVTLLPKHTNLVVSRTMSKAFALAGARVGYLAADPRIVAALQLVRLPYHLSALTQAAARVALRHHHTLQARVDEIRQRRDATVAYLRSVGYQVIDSDANFVYFGPFSDRDRVFSELLARGVLIRVTGPEPWLRVTIGTAAEMELFRSALKEVTA